MSSKHLLPAEWNKQEAILIAWPHVKTDWKNNLVEIENTYIQIASAIAESQQLMIVCMQSAPIKSLLKNANRQNIKYLEIPTNDTWIRDFGPIITIKNGVRYLNDFDFDGWNNQFEYSLDNAVNKSLPNEDLCGNKYKYFKHEDFFIEGGNLESNGHGLLITAEKPWFKTHLKDGFHKMITSRKLKNKLGVEKIFWIKQGQIEGDDTFGHIDNLVRFISKNKVLYVQCEDIDYPHYKALKEMEKQLFDELSKAPYNIELIPIPLPTDVYANIRRLPASYLNFVFINGGLLFPTFNSEIDELVLNKFKELLPSRAFFKIDARTLITQNGGLHCATQNIF